MTRKTRRTIRFLHGIAQGQLAMCDPWRGKADAEIERIMREGLWQEPWEWVFCTSVSES